MVDPKLTQVLQRETKTNIRWVSCMRTLGMSEIRRQVTGHLYVDRRPASVSALSASVGYSRRAVRVQLLDGVSRTTVGLRDGGWVLTPAGVMLVDWMLYEARQVSLGELECFSGEFMTFVRQYALPSDKPVGLD